MASRCTICKRTNSIRAHIATARRPISISQHANNHLLTSRWRHQDWYRSVPFQVITTIMSHADTPRSAIATINFNLLPSAAHWSDFDVQCRRQVERYCTVVLIHHDNTAGESQFHRPKYCSLVSYTFYIVLLWRGEMFFFKLRHLRCHE